MSDEDIESGGQTDDSDAGGEEPEADTGGDEGGERQAARDTDTSDRPSRKERRANRMREANEAREAAIREAAELRSRVAAAEAAAQEAHRRIEERERSSQANNETTQKRERINQIRRQAQTHLAMSAQLKGAEAQKEWDEFQRLQDEADDLRDELRDADRWEKRKQELGGMMPNQALSEERQYFQSKDPWVATTVEGRALADGRFNALVAGGRPATRQTMEEAITYAAKTLRIGGNGTPGPASRNAYVGTGQRDGEGDGGGQGGSMTIEDVRNNLALKRMALSLFKDDDEHVAYAKFAKQIGNKALRPD
jgi:hypothetical protein